MSKSLMFFNSIHHVIKAETVLTSSGIKVQVVPVPSRIKADCGLALQFETPFVSQVKKVLGQESIPYDDVLPTE